LPGTPRRDIDPAVIQDQLERLTVQVARLMETREVPGNMPEPLSEHPKCFVVMPFGVQDLEDLYSEFILPVLADCRLDCARGDDIFGLNVVMDDVKAAIAKADLVIADLSGQNPNVFYEVGIAHNTHQSAAKGSWRSSENTFWQCSATLAVVKFQIIRHLSHHSL